MLARTMRTLVFVAVYDQERELPQVLDEIDAAAHPGVEYLIVDNGSSDRSVQMVRACRHHTMRIEKNVGVGNAYALALDWALARTKSGDGPDVFCTMAGNGKMLASELGRLIGPVERGEADYVTGSRFLEGGGSPNLPGFRRAAIPMVSRFASAIVGQHLTDATNGFRAFRLEMLRHARFDWHDEWLRTYGFEYYLYAKVILEPRLRAIEVPTTMRYPPEGAYSKIKPGMDWVRMLEPWVVARLDGRSFDDELPLRSPRAAAGAVEAAR